MDRFHAMQVFVAAAEAGSFAKAAEQLGLSAPSVTRTIAALETRLRTRVFMRTTRSLSLTQVGARYLETARRLLAELEAAENEAVGASAVPSGRLVVTAPASLGRIALAPIIGAFLDAHPRVDVAVMLLERVVSLVEEGVDLAVRIGALPESSLVARRVGRVRRVLVASPDYLARRGRPQAPEDLVNHQLIGFAPLMPNGDLRFGEGRGAKTVSLAPRLMVNDLLVASAVAEAGHGIAPVASFAVADAVRAGRLDLVLDPYMPAPVPVSLVFAEGRMPAPKLRAFIDFAAPRLREALDRLWLERTAR